MNVDPYLRREQLDPAVWNDPEMRQALSRRDIATVFRRLNQRHGVSQRRIAELAGFAPSEVYEIVRGRQVMAYDVLGRIADGLGIPRGYMGLAHTGQQSDPGSEPRSPAALEKPNDRRAFLAALAGIAVGGSPAGVEPWLPQPGEWPGPVPDVVDRATIATIRAITDEHRHVDARYGGGSCRDSARGYLVWARCLLRSRCRTEALNAALCRELADLHNLVGWMCHDLGEHGDARRYLAQGLLLAQSAADLSLMADSYYRFGRVSIHEGDPAEALSLFQLGQIVAQNSGCLTSVAILHANIAWAYAKMGNAAAVRDSLARAADELGRADVAVTPEWTRFFVDPADIDGISGLVYASLARHDEHRNTYAPLAVEHATQALARRPERTRSASLDHVTVAMGHALQGHAEELVPHARAVLDAVGVVRSRRLVDRLRNVADAAEPLATTDPDVAAVVHDIRTVVPA